MFGDCVPHPHLPGVAGGDELVTNEEESLSGDVETEDACGEGETRCFLLLGAFPEQLIKPTSRFLGKLCAETRTDFIAVAVGANGPEDDLRHRGDSHHLVIVSQRPAHHFGVERDSVDHPVEAGRGEDLLPPGRLLHPERGGGKRISLNISRRRGTANQKTISLQWEELKQLFSPSPTDYKLTGRLSMEYGLLGLDPIIS